MLIGLAWVWVAQTKIGSHRERFGLAFFASKVLQKILNH